MRYLSASSGIETENIHTTPNAGIVFFLILFLGKIVSFDAIELLCIESLPPEEGNK